MRNCLSVAYILLFWSATVSPLFARLPAFPGQEDIRGMAHSAPFVFRGKVVQVDLTKIEQEYKEGVVQIEVDRWYRGAGRLPRVEVHFAYQSVGFSNGHDCSDLVLGSNWILFARPGSGAVFELIHDCEGALRVSSLLAPQASGDILSRMEADFRAGLSDPDPDARLASIQRLAALGMPASLQALNGMIAQGNEVESKWATLAELKAGDISALKRVVPLLVNMHHEQARQELQPDGTFATVTTAYAQPEGEIALAVEKLRDPRAVPALITILDQAPDDLVRNCAAAALAEIADHRAKGALAAHLSDPSQYVRYNSLLGLAKITHAEACAIANPENTEQAESRCKEWLDSKN
jgi:hypothetical protein